MLKYIVILLLSIKVLACTSKKEGDNVEQRSSNQHCVNEYFPNGRIKSQTCYLNGRKDSTSISYFENGNPASVANYSDGLLYGPFTDYYEDGTPKEFRFYNGDEEGSVMFVRYYNLDGSLKEDKGQPAGVVLYTGQKISQDSTFDFELRPAIPPNCKMRIYSLSLDSKGNRVEDSLSVTVKERTFPFIQYGNFNSKGPSPIWIISELNDTLLQITRRDTFYYEVEVF